MARNKTAVESPSEDIFDLIGKSENIREASEAMQAMGHPLRLKIRAPFWKREDTPAGTRWVEARASDDVAAERWKK